MVSNEKSKCLTALEARAPILFFPIDPNNKLGHVDLDFCQVLLNSNTRLQRKKKQNRSTEGCSKFQVRKHDKLRRKWSQHRNKSKSQMGQDQVFGGVIVLCWLAAPVVMFHGNLSKFGNKFKIGNFYSRSSSVISAQIGGMSDQLRVSLYMVMSQNVI